MTGRQGFPYHFERAWVKKPVQVNRIHLATWNVGTLTDKSMVLVGTMRRRRVNIACPQKTKWEGAKANKFDGYKLWCIRKDHNRNSIGIIVENDLKDKIVDVKRVGDRLLLIKLILGDKIIDVISTYAPQAGLQDRR
ncbi:hypothetical protein AMTRI_Chr06g179400 [Amborella trichopoda]